MGTKKSVTKDGLEYLSFREFSRRVGVSHVAINEAVEHGRITSEQIGNQVFIPWVSGLSEYRANTDESRRTPEKNTEVKRKIPAGQPGAGIPTGPTYSESRAKREESKAKLAELELEEKMGSLISAEKVKKDFFEIAALVRGALFNIPTMVSPELAAETNPRKVEARLEKAIREALEALAESGYNAN